MVFYITPLRLMSNLALSGRQFESHTQKTWKKQQGGNAQQCIQGYIVPPPKKKAYRGNSTGTDNQRASESYRSSPSSSCFSHGSMKGIQTMAFTSTSTMALRSFSMHHYNTKCDKQVSEHAHTEPN